MTASATAVRVAAALWMCLMWAGTASPLSVPPVNVAELPDLRAGDHYRVWIGGHSYGPSVYPVASLLTNVERVNDSGVAALFLLGDTLRFPTAPYVRELRRSLSAFDAPVFVVPGNHEARERGVWNDEFGPSSYSMRLGSDLWIAIDMNLAQGALPGWRLEWLAEQFRSAAEDGSVRAVVVLSHHVAWTVDEPRLEPLRLRINYPPDYRRGYFARYIDPLLDDLAATRPVVWVSGDLGGFPPFYWDDPDRDVRFIGTGLNGGSDDLLVEVQSDGAGSLSVGLIRLGDRDPGRIDRYGPAYWRAHFADLPRQDEMQDYRTGCCLAVRSFVRDRRFVSGTIVGTVGALAAWAAVCWIGARRTRAA